MSENWRDASGEPTGQNPGESGSSSQHGQPQQGQPHQGAQPGQNAQPRPYYPVQQNEQTPPVYMPGQYPQQQWPQQNDQPTAYYPPATQAGGAGQPPTGWNNGQVAGYQPPQSPQWSPQYGQQGYHYPVQQGYGYQPYGQYGQYPAAPTPDPRQTKRHRTHVIIGSVASAIVAALAAGLIVNAIQSNHSGTQTTGSPSFSGNPFGSNNGSSGSGSSGSGSSGSGSGSGGFDGNGSSGSNGFGNGFGSSNGFGSGSSTGTTAKATTAQQVGVVDIDTVIDFGSGKAAGTGLVLTSDGEILTNNHVVADSTQIEVTIVSTGKSYTAKVVGTDATDDIALIKLVNASGLTTASIGDSSSAAVGQAVTGVGNAGGVGGTPSAAAGKITALNQSITASDEDGSSSEKLTGLIETDADIQAGDSGGPLYNSDNKVIGIDTAASASGQSQGYAIPINTALSIVQEIRKGQDTDKISIGYPAFLGVSLSAQSTSAYVAGVVDGSAAAKIGLVEGDTITAVNGTAVATADALSSALKQKNPGDQVSITWTDTSGSSHTATATLGEGPVA